MRTLLLAVLLAASGSVFGQTPQECGTVPVIYVTQGFLDEIVANEDAFEASWSEVRPTLPPDQQAVGDCAIVEWRLLIAQAVVTGP